MADFLLTVSYRFKFMDEEQCTTRREFVGAASIATGSVLLPIEAFAQSATPAVELNVNGQTHTLNMEPRVTLLDALRERLHLMGTKKGCDHGQCGACTVLVDGRRINSCLTFAVMHQGEKITTVEGIATGDQLHPVQTAFIQYDGFQCGYCTSGQICSAVALLDELKAGNASSVTPDVRSTGPIAITAEEIRERMSGNLCRCGAYPNIVAAVQAAQRGGSLA